MPLETKPQNATKLIFHVCFKLLTYLLLTQITIAGTDYLKDVDIFVRSDRNTLLTLLIL